MFKNLVLISLFALFSLAACNNLSKAPEDVLDFALGGPSETEFDEACLALNLDPEWLCLYHGARSYFVTQTNTYQGEELSVNKTAYSYVMEFQEGAVVLNGILTYEQLSDGFYQFIDEKASGTVCMNTLEFRNRYSLVQITSCTNGSVTTKEWELDS